MTQQRQARRRPPGVDDATVAAVGKAGEAREWLERARGRLYDFHQMIGHADLLLDEAATALDDAGHGELARILRDEIVGRNVIEGRWTYQVVEEFDATYYEPFRDAERTVRDRAAGGCAHLDEMELKQLRHTPGHPHHGWL